MHIEVGVTRGSKKAIRHAHRRKNRWCAATGVERVRRAHGIVVGGQGRVERALNAFEESHRSSVKEAGKQSKVLRPKILKMC